MNENRKETINRNSSKIGYQSDSHFPQDTWTCFTVVNGLDLASLDKSDYEFSKDCKLISTPTWVKDASFEPKSDDKIISTLRNSDVLLAFEYLANALGDPLTVNGVKTSTQQYVADLLLLFNVSAWLAGPFDVIATGFYHFRIEDSYRILRSAGDGSAVRFSEPAYQRIENVSQLEDVARIWRAVTAVRRDCSTWVALWMLHKALHERFWFVRLLIVWVALEALFGPQERQQLTHQLCERISLFIHGPTDEGQELFISLKKSYGIRSKVVHGGGLGDGSDKGVKDLQFIEQALRGAITKIFSSQKLLDVFSSKQRESYLQKLTFGGC